MRWFRRFLAFLGIVLLILVIAIGVFGVITVRRQFPQTEGVIQLPGLDAQVEVYRDSYGVPHIYAKTSHDLFMAQGFVHAQDRFWQMEFWRRVGAGRLSEIMGESALSSDRFIRTMGWHRTVAEELSMITTEERQLLEAYAEGVNAYVSVNQDRLGLEFFILGLTGVSYEPEPWEPSNTMTWPKMMAMTLGGNMDSELNRAHIAAHLGTPAVNTLMSPYREGSPIIIPSPLTNATLQAVPDEVFDLQYLGSGDGIGSNNWVTSGDRTDTGGAILANDPHLGIQMPSIWYEIGLHCDPVGPECPFDLVGTSAAGVPAVILGHNDHIAWGVTNLGPDVQDLFIERVNPENPNQYEFQGEWFDMEIIREEIRVAGEDDPVIVNVRLTRHGPIINDVIGGTEEDWSYGWQPLAFSWTALQPSTIFRSVLMLNQAQNWDQFREALRYWDEPSQNIVYADVEGNIGYQAPGRIPIRASGDGSMPVPGWTGEYEWVDFIPFDELPWSFNPPEGFIVTANNAAVGTDYPYFISMDWAPGFRARRILELIEGDPSLSVEDMQIIQADSSPLYAQEILPYLMSLKPSDTQTIEALDLLHNWDGRVVRDSAGAAIFEVMRNHMIDRIFADELGEQLLNRIRGSLAVALMNFLPDPASHWFDDKLTPHIEERDEILVLALEDAVEELTKTLGRKMSNWRWGDLHVASFENETLGQSGIGPIEALFNRGPVAVDGTIGTVNNTAYSSSNPYMVRTVPSYRQIIDLKDFDRSLSMHTTGQSGHPFHRHYNDMIDSWRNFEYHPMLWNRHLIETVAEAHMTLTPGE